MVPRGVSGPRDSGRYSVPVAPSTTTAGRISVPMGVSSWMAPVMPTTTTLATGVWSSSRSTPAVASSVPMPVTMATTGRCPRRPTQVDAPSTDSSRSERAWVSGTSSMGMAKTKATGAGIRPPDLTGRPAPAGRRRRSSG